MENLRVKLMQIQKSIEDCGKALSAMRNGKLQDDIFLKIITISLTFIFDRNDCCGYFSSDSYCHFERNVS